jgi:hypothetical protein
MAGLQAVLAVQAGTLQIFLHNSSLLEIQCSHSILAQISAAQEDERGKETIQ